MKNHVVVVAVETYLERICSDSPFIRFMGFEIADVDVAAKRLTIRVSYRPDFERKAGTGQWQGGPIAALIDTAGCLATVMASGAPFGTVNFRTDYLRVAKGDHLTAVATVRRLGRSISVADVDVLDASSRLIATGRGSFYAEPK